MTGQHGKLVPVGPIRVLPEGIANRIAAGEVVERPASVVKELIENALDAEATRISLTVRKSGLGELLVSDDGWGMDEEDIVLAFRRHATSKIYEARDLERITHLGFRGEALPSIASVSRLEVTTRREDRETGQTYRVEGGKASGPAPASRERGTTVRVRSLFYNVPARRKFLRSPATEYGHIVTVFKRYALAYPETEWELIREGESVWSLKPTDLRGRIVQLFGDKAVDELHPVESRSGDIFVGGMIGGKGLFRRSRGDQYLYVNRRPFQSSSLHHAAVNGYGPLIEARQVPFYLLMLRLDPEAFDVNVHPAKHEVRFQDESLAYRSILVAVRNALGLSIRSGGAPVRMAGTHFGGTTSRLPTKKVDGRRELELLFGRVPAARVDKDRGFASKLGDSGGKAASGPASAAIDRHETPARAGDLSLKATSGSLEGVAKAREMRAPDTGQLERRTATSPVSDVLEHESTKPAPQGEVAERLNVWQLHRTYILSQTKSGLVIIDQHVAHERILYERALSAIGSRSWSGQQLLFPVKITLDPQRSTQLEEITGNLGRMGFDVEHFGGHDWVIKGVPSGVRVESEEILLLEILDDMRDQHGVRIKPEESLAASFACKAAVKAGTALTLEEMNSLIDELFLTEYPFVCPHGRPIVVNLTLDDLHRMFGRQ